MKLSIPSDTFKILAEGNVSEHCRVFCSTPLSVFHPVCYNFTKYQILNKFKESRDSFVPN